MRKIMIKKVVIAAVIAMACLDASLLFAAQQNWSSTDATPAANGAAKTPANKAAVQQFKAWLNNENSAADAHQSAAETTATANKSGESAVPVQAVKQPYMDMAPTTNQKAAFKSVINSSMPMTPSQIIKLKKMISASERAAATNPGTPPRPVSTSLFVNLSPGTTPPVIRLAKGFISSLVFVDSNGSSWPIESIDLGNSKAFNIQWNKKGKSNTVMIQANSSYTYGNIAVKLKGLSTPVMITLIPGQKVVDYRADLRVSGQSPLDMKKVGGLAMPQSANSELLNILDGVSPAGSKTLEVQGAGCANCQAWSSAGKLYLRVPTTVTLISPGYLGMMSSPDGTKAYEVEKTPSLLVSRNGAVENVKIEGVK